MSGEFAILQLRCGFALVFACLGVAFVSACGTARPASESYGPLKAITVTPPGPSVIAGDSQQFGALATYSDGSTQDITKSVAWSSSSTSVASVSSAGLALSLAAGNATITASQSNVSGTAPLTVLPNPDFDGVLTQHNDLSRSGLNRYETILTPSTVNVNSFGKLFAQPVDGQIYAQPLYVPGVAIPGSGTHNVIYVATEYDSVFAFDADSNSGADANPLWKASLIDAAHGGAPGATPAMASAIGCGALAPYIGVTATPVIDAGAGTLFVEAKSFENGSYVHRLHAIDITTGNEKTQGPVVITATISGTGDGSSGTQITFNPQSQLSRPGILLLNGTLYLGYASHCDFFPFHGWLFAYNETTFAQQAVFNATPNGGLGGFWTSGAAPSADANGNIYIASGNGTFDTMNVPATEFGDTIMKLTFSSGAISVADYFTPTNQFTLDEDDVDVGSGGVLLLPDQPGLYTHLMVEGGKQGRLYVLDRDLLTANNQHYCSGCQSDPQIVQESAPGLVVTLFATPAYLNGTIYLAGAGDMLKAIPLSGGLLNFNNITTSSETFGFPGVTPSISSNGAANGIVWAIDSSQFGSPGPSVLHAYNATNIANELWSSSMAANNRDAAGNAVKFTVPTIANGKVYLGTSTEVDVYGLLP